MAIDFLVHEAADGVGDVVVEGLKAGQEITGIDFRPLDREAVARQAEAMGLVLKAVPDDQLDAEVEALADRMASVPVNQLAMQKMVINQAIEAMGVMNTQRLATIFDGITRHSPEGVWFKRRAEEVGFKQAVAERDSGAPIAPDASKRLPPLPGERD